MPLVLQPVTAVITDGETIGALCIKRPLALPVLQQLGVELADPNATLDACCAARGLSAAVATAAIVGAEDVLATRWRDRSLDELIDDIVRTYHRPFALEIAAVSRAFEAARDATGHADWSVMLAELEELQLNLSQHIEMEERVVFPWLRGRSASASSSIRAMQLEHGDTIAHLLVIEALARRRAAGDPSSVDAVACLHRFERWLCEHIHLESNALFPLALQADARR